MAGSRIAFRVDASPRMGGGHVMRCLTLARRLIGAGAEILFIAAAIPDPLRRLVAEAGIRVAGIAPAPGSAHSAHDWDRASWDEAVQREDAERTAALLAGRGYDWLLVDHYGLDARWEARVRATVGRIAVIDDLANRPHACALLVDQTFGRDPADYAPLTGAAAELLVGADYALLRPEFAEARPAALARHCAPGPVDRILISLGMTDVGGLTGIAARAALDRTDAAIDIVLGSAAPTLDAVRELAAGEPRVALHVDTPDVCGLMVAADLAIGAAGTTSWERCCLGLPAITFAIAGNQRLIAAKLAEAGAIRLLDSTDPQAIGDALAAVSADRELRLRLARASAAICDGEGAARVASRMLD